jgi:hypothetical protein
MDQADLLMAQLLQVPEVTSLNPIRAVKTVMEIIGN